ncbi:MAG: anion permease [Candidatus Binatia bacterium]|nr:MAG: anion permease [Candidatus Binatia bacterium]
MEVLLCFAAVLFLAYANGANDNAKPVATLEGASVLGPKGALALATGAALAGGLLAVFWGEALARRFQGAGIVPAELTREPRFLFAVAASAASTVFVASRTGLPVSTTHALLGALAGAALGRVGGALGTGALVSGMVAPLLLSPVLAFALCGGVFFSLRPLAARFGGREECLCVVETPVPLGAGPAPAARSSLLLHRGAGEECRQAGWPGISVPFDSCLRALHVLSAAAVGVARSLNDTPKIAGLLLGLGGASSWQLFLPVILAVCVGGWLRSAPVARTMSRRITPMDESQALSANLATAFLVLWASRLGLPVSTTHTACGSLFAVAALRGDGSKRWVSGVAWAWLATAPVAGALAYVLVSLR